MARRRGGGKGGKQEEKVPVASSLYMIGGRGDEGQALSSVEFLETKQILQEWRPITAMPEERWGASAACWGDKVYVFGGYNGGAIMKSGLAYDPTTCEWKPIPDMSSRRAHATATACGKRIYLCGGWGGSGGPDSALETAERFDPTSCTWEALPNMSAKRFNLAAASNGPMLYVFGGYGDKSDPLKSVERLDVREAAAWESLPPMLERRQGAAAAVVHGLPYVFGGHDGLWCLRTVERFNVDPKGPGGQWQAMPSMLSPRYDCMACTCVHNDRRAKAFVFGGHNGIERVNEVECFDVDSNEWEPVPKNPNSTLPRMEIRAGAAVAAMLESEKPQLADAGLLGTYVEG